MFAVPPYWEERGERFHRISKGCDSEYGCLQRKEALDGQTCERSAYHDWSCVDCCTGDLCNYFVTVTSFFTLLGCLTEWLILKVICNDFLVVRVNCWSHALI